MHRHPRLRRGMTTIRKNIKYPPSNHTRRRWAFSKRLIRIKDGKNWITKLYHLKATLDQGLGINISTIGWCSYDDRWRIRPRLWSHAAGRIWASRRSKYSGDSPRYNKWPVQVVHHSDGGTVVIPRWWKWWGRWWLDLHVDWKRKNATWNTERISQYQTFSFLLCRRRRERKCNVKVYGRM